LFRSIYIAFDLLYLNRKDLRTLPLIERKRQLRKLSVENAYGFRILDHVENDGRQLFEPATSSIPHLNSRIEPD
jgi:bifunctional non-homologous end joining protein LigD